MPINDYRGYKIGWMLRHYSELDSVNKSIPKAISYWDNRNVPLMHFEWHDYDDDSFVLVEDIISAKKVSRYRNAIALLGTGLTDDSVSALVEMGVKTIDIALDGDAWRHAKKLKDEYSLFFLNFNVIVWSKDAEGNYPDPKDMTNEQLEEVFG